jgi:hypothetical protein
MTSMTDPRDVIASNRFAATRWSLVAAAGASDPVGARRALIELCLRYWYPVYAYVRGSGHAPNVTRVLVRGFFEHLLDQRLSLADARARGRFRAFLLESLSRFLGGDWRGTLQVPPVAEFEQPLSWDELEARYQTDAGQGRSPEQSYQRNYALEVLAGALARLQQEAVQAGRGAMFAAMQPLLGTEPVPGQIDAIAQQLGLRPLAAVIALKRLRQRYRELADAELCETVGNADDLQAERETLARALGLA